MKLDEGFDDPVLHVNGKFIGKLDGTNAKTYFYGYEKVGNQYYKTFIIKDLSKGRNKIDVSSYHIYTGMVARDYINADIQ